MQDYQYDSFGNLKDLKNRIKQPYTYTGREYDRETGQYYYRARYYDAEAGRFTQKDPIGFEGSAFNLFAYALNNPVNFIDPKGLYTEVLIWQPVGWFSSSFGHVSTNINGTTYSYGPQGMAVMPTNEYMNRNSFRDGVGSVLNISPDQEDCLKTCISGNQGSYSSIGNNCGSPIQNCLNQLGFNFSNITPVSFLNSLLRSGLVRQKNYYYATRH